MPNLSFLPKRNSLLVTCLLIGITITVSSLSNKKEKKYLLSDIPKELLENSKAVVRDNNYEFVINSPGSATLMVTSAITILNENGIDNSVFYQTYGDFNKLKFKGAVIYSADGEEQERFSSGDLIETGTASGYSLFDNIMVAYLDPEYRSVPFTIEYSYEMVFKGLLQFPSWSPYTDYNVSIQSASLKVTASDSYKFRFIEKNGINSARIAHESGLVNYFWEEKNLVAIKPEPFSPSQYEYLPVVFTAPSEFEIDGYAGNSETWDQFGIWIGSLMSDRQTLPEATVNSILEMTAEAESDEEKVKILYEYLQSKTRYVSVQVGIGGWQPFKAIDVDNTSYGDCKALSNYMVAILKAAGVRSHYTLVRAGDDVARMIPEFTSNQFNHAIVCVPNNGDTIWLECTSQSLPYGYLGSFTDDRYVLLIDEEGGKVSRTKVYDADDNTKSRSAEIFLDNNTNGRAVITTSYKGKFYSDKNGLLSLDETDRRKRVVNSINIPNFNLQNYSLIEKRAIYPEIKLYLDLELINYITFTGNRLILPLNLMEKVRPIPYSLDKRSAEIDIRRSEISIDTLIYHLPEGYNYSGDPVETLIESDFGTYSTTVYPNSSTITYIRKLVLNRGLFPADHYQDYIDFNEKIIKADNNRILIQK